MNLGAFSATQRDVGRVELQKTAFLRRKPFCVSQMQRKSSSPLRKTNQLSKHQNCGPSSTRFSHHGKNASFLKGSQYILLLALGKNCLSSNFVVNGKLAGA